MSQTSDILNHLKQGGELNPMLALERFGCMRLAARISDLRSEGYQIETLVKKSHSGKVYASYRLVGGGE